VADAFDQYLGAINKAVAGGDATEHTHRPALKTLVEGLGKEITAVNEPRRIACGAPDLRIARKADLTIGYIECKDIGANLTKEARSEQVKKRYLPSLGNFILTDYLEFRWYLRGEIQLTARLGHEGAGGRFKATAESKKQVGDLFTAFLSQESESIKTAKDLAVRMAALARLLRDVIVRTFEQEGGRGQLHGQLEAFRKVLIHDLTEGQFADMYAQTICYGLFTAHCHIGAGTPRETFTRKEAGYLLPKTNPFLRKMFNEIAGPDLDDRIAWIVDDVVGLLARARMGDVLEGFAQRSKGLDPVVHFYETFLREYDAKLRKVRGVYYTPEAVVRYIVRSVDELLRDVFGLKHGLADSSKVRRAGNGGCERESHRCLILDPAVGTGTFLFEVVEHIHDRFKRHKGMWSGYVRDHLLPRVFGFELMMAPYAVAHMKLGLELNRTGYDFESEERLGIYLTNTLEDAQDMAGLPLFTQWLAQEAREANAVKRDLPIMVVLGNPPYANYGMMNKGKWILQLLEEYKTGLQEKKLNLDDDFIKFIRYGQHRIEQTGAGVLAFITNNTYIDGITHRRMRESLLTTFSDIYILNLHGDSGKKEVCPDGSKDENVFDIKQGTAIGIFVRKPGHKGLGRVHYRDCWGRRAAKYEYLSSHSVATTDWVRIRHIDRDSCLGRSFFFVPKQFENIEQYCDGVGVDSIFPVNQSGLKTDRDSLFVDFDRSELKRRMKMFYSPEGIRPPFSDLYRVEDSSSYDITTRRLRTAFDERCIRRCTYRPFDERWLYYDGELTSRPAWEVMQHILDRGNRALLTMRQYDYEVPEYCYGFAANALIECRVFVSKRGVACVVPLYIYPNGSQQDLDYENWPRGEGGRVPNLSRKYVEELAGCVKLAFVADGRGDLKKTFGPEDVFEYVYAVLHSPEYRRRYAEFLKTDFPRIPWPTGRAVFREFCGVGRQLLALHLMEAAVLEDEKRWPAFPEEGNMTVEAGYPKYMADAERTAAGRVYINKDQYFEGVRPEVWEFHVGGYQVCEKWLKDRRGRTLSYGDVNHYQKVVVALDETIRLMEANCMTAMFEG